MQITSKNNKITAILLFSLFGGLFVQSCNNKSSESSKQKSQSSPVASLSEVNNSDLLPNENNAGSEEFGGDNTNNTSTNMNIVSEEGDEGAEPLIGGSGGEKKAGGEASIIVPPQGNKKADSGVLNTVNTEKEPFFATDVSGISNNIAKNTLLVEDGESPVQVTTENEAQSRKKRASNSAKTTFKKLIKSLHHKKNHDKIKKQNQDFVENNDEKNNELTVKKAETPLNLNSNLEIVEVGKEMAKEPISFANEESDKNSHTNTNNKVKQVPKKWSQFFSRKDILVKLKKLKKSNDEKKYVEFISETTQPLSRDLSSQDKETTQPLSRDLSSQDKETKEPLSNAFNLQDEHHFSNVNIQQNPSEIQKLIDHLNEINGLQLKIWSLCRENNQAKNSTVYDNNLHKTPIAFVLFDSNNLPLQLTKTQLTIIKDHLIIKNLINQQENLLTEDDKKFDNFTRCADGSIPKESHFSNVFYIKNKLPAEKLMRLTAALKLIGFNQEIRMNPNEAIKIPIKVSSQIDKHNLFENFVHVFKTENITTKEKYKYITSEYNGKYKNNENVSIFINKISIIDENGRVVNFLPMEGKLANTVNGLNQINIGQNKILTHIEFFDLKKQEYEIKKIFLDHFSSRAFEFSGVKNLANAITKIQKNNKIGFLLKIDNIYDSENHSPVTVELYGNDSFGNPIKSIIKDSKW